MISIYQNLIKEYKKIKNDDLEGKHMCQDKIYKKFIININNGDITLNEIEIISNMIVDIIIKDDVKLEKKGQRWYA
jgi:hypothetical protein